MPPPVREQRNPYKGSPFRAFLRVELIALDGSAIELEVLADTGNPCAIVVASSNMQRCKRRAAPDKNTNFGVLEGGWLRLRISAIGLDELVLGYASDAVVAATQQSSPDFEGLGGLPLLCQAEYGGDATAFWLRVAAVVP